MTATVSRAPFQTVWPQSRGDGDPASRSRLSGPAELLHGCNHRTSSRMLINGVRIHLDPGFVLIAWM